MWKLKSEVGKWSFLNGEMIFSNVVWLSDKEEAKKYMLIDEKGNKMDINVNDYLVEE